MSKNTKKMSYKIIIGITIGTLLLMMTLVLYKVDVTEYAVVTQFGNPVNTILSPGLNVKLPDPIQSVRKFDKRVQIFQADPLELLTLDKKSIAVD